MNVQEIREDFPILKDVIYLDSAATSLTPEPVLEAILSYYRSYRANVGRGVYRHAQIADQRYRDAHRKVAGFVGGVEGNLVFTRNTTESINIVAQGLDWKRRDLVVTTLLEHHSNLLPWMRLREVGIDLEVIVPDKEGIIELAEYEKAIKRGTRLVAISHLSNALGSVQPVAEISEICRDQGAALLVDAAQSVPHMAVDVRDIDCDFLCFSGHKMLGPTGSGVLWMKGHEEQRDNERVRASRERSKRGLGEGRGRMEVVEKGEKKRIERHGKGTASRSDRDLAIDRSDRTDLEPLLVGGGMVEDVSDNSYTIKSGYEGFEAGTPDISAGIGLAAAVDYLARIGMESIHEHEKRLTGKLLEGLEEIKGLEVFGPGQDSSAERGGVVSFGIKDLLPHEIALMLDQASNISIRSGHHCCIPLMKHLGLKHGTARASLYLYNTEEEVEKLLGALEQIARMA